jgi:hypothetical protein
VASDPPGIDCATDCTQGLGAGRQVTLTATAMPGSVFAGWAGACAGAGAAATCTIAMNGDQVAGASFAALPPPVVPPPPPPVTPARAASVTLKQLRIAPSTLHRARKADRPRRRRARRATRAKVSVTLSRPAKVTARVAIARSGVRRGPLSATFRVVR